PHAQRRFSEIPVSKGSCLGEGHAPSLPGSDTLLCLRDFAKSTIILNQNKRLASKLPFPPVGRLSSKSRWNREAAPAKIEAPRGSGGTGRRARLRILWPKGRGGSNPSFRTNLSLTFSLSTDSCLRVVRIHPRAVRRRCIAPPAHVAHIKLHQRMHFPHCRTPATRPCVMKAAVLSGLEMIIVHHELPDDFHLLSLMPVDSVKRPVRVSRVSRIGRHLRHNTFLL